MTQQDQTPRGVADHPAREQMEEIWRNGGRAAEIVEWLEENELPVLKAGTIGRYGQRNWTEKVTITSDSLSPDSINELLDEIEASNLGTVTKVGFSRKRYPGWEKVDGVSIPVEKESVAQTIEIRPSERTSRLEPARLAPITVNVLPKPSTSPSKPSGVRLAVVVPDMQIGFHRDTQGALTTTHDEAALDVFHQLLGWMDFCYGVDLVVNLGDNLDFAMFSKHRSAPGFCSPEMTQLAIDRYGTEVSVQRSLAEDAEIIALGGNHEARLTNTLVDTPKVENAVGLRVANSPESEPVLSIPNLCRFGEYGVKYLEPWPDATHWANNNLRFIHGHLVSGTLGGTASKILAKASVSTVYGHIHRQELLHTRIETGEGVRDIFAGSPGAMCRLDGVLPSGQTGITASGSQAGTSYENWQHGIFLVWYTDPNSNEPHEAWCEPLQIRSGRAVYGGKMFTASVTPNGEPL